MNKDLQMSLSEPSVVRSLLCRKRKCIECISKMGPFIYCKLTTQLNFPVNCFSILDFYFMAQNRVPVGHGSYMYSQAFLRGLLPTIVSGRFGAFAEEGEGETAGGVSRPFSIQHSLSLESVI